MDDPSYKKQPRHDIFVLDGIEQVVTEEKFKNLNFEYFGKYNRNNFYDASGYKNGISNSFNDLYIVGFTNVEKSWRINSLKKDDIFLEVIEIKNNTSKRVLLEKPDFTLLKGDQFAKNNSDINFACRLNNNDNFDMIIKSLSADLQTVILYKATYNFDGKKSKNSTFRHAIK